MSGAHAHHGEATLADAAATWTFDPLIIGFLVVLAGLYESALWRRRIRGHSPDWRRVGAFVAALAVAAVALISPLHELGHGMVSAHMLQHVLLISVVAPLVVLARPGLSAAFGEPIRRWLRAAGHPTLVRAGRRLVQAPALATVVMVGVVLGWHAPVLYDAAVANPVVHYLEHASFVAVSLWYWAGLVAAVRSERFGVAVAMIVGFVLPKTALAAVMAFSAWPWYATAQTTAAWGLDPLNDQHTAGLAMWMPGKAVLLVALLVVMAKLLAREPRLELAR